MAIITVPNAASVFAACAVVPGANDRWISLGFIATPGGSGSCAFLSGSTPSTASPLLPIVVPTNSMYQSPIFNSPFTPISVASISGGCAIVWLHAACHA